MRGGARKGTGGAMPGAGRKPSPVPTKHFSIKLTTDQHTEFKLQGGSPWLQGELNLKIIERQKAMSTHPQNLKPLHTPKGSMCMACAHKLSDCSHLNFEAMPVIERKTHQVIVQCSDFVKAEK